MFCKHLQIFGRFSEIAKVLGVSKRLAQHRIRTRFFSPVGSSIEVPRLLYAAGERVEKIKTRRGFFKKS